LRYLLHWLKNRPLIGVGLFVLLLPVVAALFADGAGGDVAALDPANEWFISAPAALASNTTLDASPSAQQSLPTGTYIRNFAQGNTFGFSPVQQTALSSAQGTGTLPSPLEQNAASKEFIEGHWLGLEVIPLTPELAQEYGIPDGEQGVLVDEVTLEAAESGILAGDMVHAINGRATPDLEEFFHATIQAQGLGQATIEVGRRGPTMSFGLTARNTSKLGFAQMEAAQPIKPGSISPHRSRGKACTKCHIIMKTGGQLPTDGGDILPTPPPIRPNATPLHENRGACYACHAILR